MTGATKDSLGCGPSVNCKWEPNTPPTTRPCGWECGDCDESHSQCNHAIYGDKDKCAGNCNCKYRKLDDDGNEVGGGECRAHARSCKCYS